MSIDFGGRDVGSTQSTLGTVVEVEVQAKALSILRVVHDDSILPSPQCPALPVSGTRPTASLTAETPESARTRASELEAFPNAGAKTRAITTRNSVADDPDLIQERLPFGPGPRSTTPNTHTPFLHEQTTSILSEQTPTINNGLLPPLALVSGWFLTLATRAHKWSRCMSGGSTSTTTED